jgi:geranylgeranyl diphosphate synthase type I
LTTILSHDSAYRIRITKSTFRRLRKYGNFLFSEGGAVLSVTESDRFMTAHSVLAWSQAESSAAFRVAVDSLPESMRRIAGYHFGWWNEHGRPTEGGGGKSLRPAIALLAAEAVGGTSGAALPAAVAVEMVHNFSLLHDDVMDCDETRRHRLTAWRVFGTSAAILAGDSMLTLAFDVVAASGHPAAIEAMKMLSTAVQCLVLGQSMDTEFESRDDVGPDECATMARNKTGALLACSAAVGALAGGGTPHQIERLHEFGADLGLAFQFVDDLLGIWGDPAVTGKPVYSDLHNRKKSLPVVRAIASGTPAGHELAGLYHRDQPLSDSEVRRAAELIELSGARAWSQDQADSLFDASIAHLHAAELAAEPAQGLIALAKFATRRDH